MGAKDEFFRFLTTVQDRGERDVIDVSVLKAKLEFSTTPVALAFSDTQTAFINMPAVIVSNFAKYGDRSIEKYGLDYIKKIITKNPEEDDTKLQLMMMVHLSKLIVDDPASLFMNVEGATIRVDNTEALNSWMAISRKVLQHTGVQSVIAELIEETFGTEYSQRVTTTSSVSVKMFKTNEFDLRGFAGFNDVHINQLHFENRAFYLRTAEGSVFDRENIILMDVVSVCLHVLGHIKVRQVFDNLNFCTPNVMVKRATSGEFEFGRIVEKRIFGAVVNWVDSYRNRGVPAAYAADFVTALNNNSPLPMIPKGVHFKERGSSIMPNGCGGVDFVFERDVYIE